MQAVGVALHPRVSRQLLPDFAMLVGIAYMSHCFQ